MTGFQEKVYKLVKKIPRGKVMTYKEVAEAIGRPRACRAVGNVLNKNTDPKVPCHRVIRSDGKIGGYRKGIKKKIELLKNEGVCYTKFRHKGRTISNYQPKADPPRAGKL